MLEARPAAALCADEQSKAVFQALIADAMAKRDADLLALQNSNAELQAQMAAGRLAASVAASSTSSTAGSTRGGCGMGSSSHSNSFSRDAPPDPCKIVVKGLPRELPSAALRKLCEGLVRSYATGASVKYFCRGPAANKEPSMGRSPSSPHGDVGGWVPPTLTVVPCKVV